MTDVFIFNTSNGGDIIIENGVIELSNGITASVYMSLFGGNIEDDGSVDSRKQWWANFNEVDDSRKQRSRFQFLTGAIPAIPSNLLRVQEAAGADLEWMTRDGLATSVDVVATMPDLNTVALAITVIADDNEQTIVYSANWRGGST